MRTRNTEVLTRIIKALGDLVASPTDALSRLEAEFHTELLIVAGDIQKVAQYAEHLRLAIIDQECGVVLDHISETHAAEITIDQIEDAINALFPDRFMEP